MKIEIPENRPKMIPFNQIKVDELNSRHNLPDIPGLAKSIQEVGLKSALLVSNGGDAKHPYTLAAGYRRHAALVSLGWGSREVPVIVVDDNIVDNLIENIQREDLHPLDCAKRISQMLRGDYPVPQGQTPKVWARDELAQKLGKSVQHIKNLARIYDNIPSDQRRRLESKDVSFRLLIQWAGMEAEAQAAAIDTWVSEQEELAKAGKAKKTRGADKKKRGSKGEGEGEGGGARTKASGFVSENKKVRVIKVRGLGEQKVTLGDYVRVLEMKRSTARGKEEVGWAEGAKDMLEWIIGHTRGLPTAKLNVSDLKTLLAEEAAEAEIEEEEVSEEDDTEE